MFEGARAKRPFSYGIWFFAGVFFLAGAFLTPIFNRSPAAVDRLGDLVANPVSWFVMLIGLFFVFRPLWMKIAAPTPSKLEVYDSKLKAEVEALHQKIGVVIDDYQNMRGQEARFTDMLDKLKGYVREEGEAWRMANQVLSGKLSELDGLPAKVEGVRVDGSIATQDLANLAEAIALFKKSVSKSRYAIYVRELLAELAVKIEEDAAILCGKIDGGHSHDTTSWDRWENVHQRWHELVHGWYDTGRWYAPAIRDRIFKVADVEYDGEWHLKDSQFPNADAVRKYKRHRIIQNHWEEIKAEVMDGVRRVAFEGTSEKEAHHGKFHQVDG